jgi:PKD repeat protein
VGNNLVIANDDDFAVGDSNGKLIVKLNPSGLVDGCEILVIPQATATVNVTVNPVNDIPSFTKGADQTVLENAGLTSVAGWATNLSAGPANEAAQALSFTLTNTNNALFSAQPAVAANGTLTFTPAPNAFGEATVTAVLKDDGGTANGGVDTAAAQLFKITVTKVNEAPLIASILANPNPADVGQAVAFSATVTDADNDPLTYTWNWGDNTTGVGATPTKTYTAAGTYTVTLTVDDGQGGTATKTLTVNVMGAGFEMDTDGDGLSDAIEIAAGSKPDDATSVPNGVTANPTPVDLAVGRLTIKFSFAKGGADSIMLTGSLPVPDGFDLSGKTVVLSVAGVAKSFTLDGKGSSPRANDSFKLSKPKDGSAKFTAKFAKGTFAETLESAGLTNDNFAAKDNKRVDIAITALFNGKVYKETVTQTYIAKKDGKAGTK